MSLKTIKAFRPFGMGPPEPVVHRVQALKMKTGWAALTVPAAADKAGSFQHLEMFGYGGLRQRRVFCQLDDASLAGREALEDRPAGGIGKSREGAA